MSTEISGPDLERLIALAQESSPAEKVFVAPDPDEEAELAFLLTHPARKLTDLTSLLDKRLPNPRHRDGQVSLTGLDSFIDYVNRMREPTSVLFANGKQRTITCVFDYHEPVNVPDAEAMKRLSIPGEPDSAPPIDLVPMVQAESALPRWGRFRASYAFPFSTQWEAWAKNNKQGLNQFALADHIEANILDIAPITSVEQVPPGPARDIIVNLNLRLGGPKELVTTARGFKLQAKEAFNAKVDTTTGEITILYEQTHANGEAAAPEEIKAPSSFILSIPVFDGDSQPSGLLVTLRYRKAEKSITWTYDVYSMQSTLERVFRQSCDRIRDATNLPLFFGEPA